LPVEVTDLATELQLQALNDAGLLELVEDAEPITVVDAREVLFPTSNKKGN
jgi:hypothetical protein